MIIVYGIKNCDSVKKALKFLNANNIAYEFVDFKVTPVGQDVITRWLQLTDITTLLNTRGTTYRNLGLKNMDLDDNEKANWLAKENLLIKRPVIVYNSDIIVGYNLPQYEGAFLS